MNVRYALNVMVSVAVLLYAVLRTSILTDLGVVSLGLHAHRAEEAAGEAALANAAAGPWALGSSPAGVRAIVEPGAGPGAVPNRLEAGDWPSSCASLPGVSSWVPPGA